MSRNEKLERILAAMYAAHNAESPEKVHLQKELDS